MKRIYLIRHAKSSWDDPVVRDHERTLNDRGRADAPVMGRRLKDGGHLPDSILTSTAVRAVSTAESIAEQVGFPLERIVELADIYNAGPNDYYRIINGLDDSVENVFIVGHNPSISEFASLLTRKPVGTMPTCAIYCAESPLSSWKEIEPQQTASLVFFDAPKFHPGK